MCSHSVYWFYFKVGCKYFMSTLSDYYENLSIIFYAMYIRLLVGPKPLHAELPFPMRVKNTNIVIPDNLNKVEQLKYKLNNSYIDKLITLNVYDDYGDQYAVNFICFYGNDLYKLYKFYEWL